MCPFNHFKLRTHKFTLLNSQSAYGNVVSWQQTREQITWLMLMLVIQVSCCLKHEDVNLWFTCSVMSLQQWELEAVLVLGKGKVKDGWRVGEEEEGEGEVRGWHPIISCPNGAAPDGHGLILKENMTFPSISSSDSGEQVRLRYKNKNPPGIFGSAILFRSALISSSVATSGLWSQLGRYFLPSGQKDAVFRFILINRFN